MQAQGVDGLDYGAARLLFFRRNFRQLFCLGDGLINVVFFHRRLSLIKKNFFSRHGLFRTLWLFFGLRLGGQPGFYHTADHLFKCQTDICIAKEQCGALSKLDLKVFHPGGKLSSGFLGSDKSLLKRLNFAGAALFRRLEGGAKFISLGGMLRFSGRHAELESFHESRMLFGGSGKAFLEGLHFGGMTFLKGTDALLKLGAQAEEGLLLHKGRGFRCRRFRRSLMLPGRSGIAEKLGQAAIVIALLGWGILRHVRQLQGIAHHFGEFKDILGRVHILQREFYNIIIFRLATRRNDIHKLEDLFLMLTRKGSFFHDTLTVLT